MKTLILTIIAAFAISCGMVIGEDEAIQTLQDAGYTQTKCTDNHFILPWFYGCESNNAAFECTAKNVNGKTVDLMVCTGILKGSTIRH
jgi:hypothetical protein